jgi:hypothetical protein
MPVETCVDQGMADLGYLPYKDHQQATLLALDAILRKVQGTSWLAFRVCTRTNRTAGTNIDGA